MAWHQAIIWTDDDVIVNAYIHHSALMNPTDKKSVAVQVMASA